ncbi:RING membrane-anchor 3 [Hibiscus trionum]|uniref:E3 ubiquitin-protein ligase RMA n=1 Tax=Hibiscus trionum TaxID=183268 RepID=A0A9W7GQ32_HIBTR|nr:RING membrane-anchor 3 [Hibiscus trionum]
MAMDPNSFEQEGHSGSGDNSRKHKWNSVSAPTRDLQKDTSGFDCNICFDSAQDPVVTLCGHLYCWPCIYKWLHVQTSSLDTDQPERNCPVCKANISSTSLVPLYGRGTSSDSQSKDHHSDLAIPQRPPPFGLNPMTTSSHPSQQHNENLFHSESQSFHHQQYFPHPYGGYETLASSSLGGIAMTNFFNPMFGMLGEMVYARISGSSNTSMLTYPYQSSHPFLVNNNLRMRRQEMQVEKSLSRVSIFLFCCIIICLLLF